MKEKYFVLFSVFACVSEYAVADFGIGVSLRDESTSIYFPVNISDKVFIEGIFNRADAEVGTESYKQKVESTELGIGVFAKSRSTENAELYYGGRFSYLEGESSVRGQYESEFDGYKIAPTLGFQYEIMKQLYIAGEVEWYFFDTDSEYEGDSMQSDGVNKQNSTDTRVLIRYFF